MAPSTDMPQKYAAAVKAAAGVVKRAGGLEFGVAYDTLPANSNWLAFAKFDGDNVVKEHGGTPAVAADKLARELLDGAICRRCNHVISAFGANDPVFCNWRRDHDVWVPGCGQSIDSTIEMKARF